VSQQIVEQAKADLVAAGFDISGNDGAFLITMEAASRIPGAGVLDKPNGNHAGFRGASYAVDIIAFPDGRIVDVLADAGLESRPTWNDGNAPVDRTRNPCWWQDGDEQFVAPFEWNRRARWRVVRLHHDE
jgi:hypothetical protein